MIARPAWEKPLRHKLRGWRTGRPHLRRVLDHACFLIFLFIFKWILADGGERTLGEGGGATGLGVVSGMIGALLAVSLRARWEAHGWLLDWTPATPAVAWKLRTREHLSAITTALAVTLLLSWLVAALSDQTTTMTALAGASLSMACGFLLAGGRISTGLLYFAIVLVFLYAVIGGWFGFGHGELSMRLAEGANIIWLPILPWSLTTHGTPVPVFHWAMLGIALTVSLREWWGAWNHRNAPAFGKVALPSAALTEEPAGEYPAKEIEPSQEEEDESGEDQRRYIRQHIAHAWFGMAGYLPDGPQPRFERMLWRWFTPRQRFLSCLGSQEALAWFPRTLWTAAALAAMVMLAMLLPWLEGKVSISDHGFWVLVSFIALAAGAIFAGWPGRNSSFQSWLELMQTPELGSFPAFAVLPVTASEWVRTAAKEWLARSVWFCSLWSAAIILGWKAFASDAVLLWGIASAVLPWLILATWFPLSIMHRIVRAVSGPSFRMHGASRVIPALLAGVVGLVAGGATFMGIGTGNHLAAVAALATGALAGALSIWQTLRRCRGMRLDLKPGRPG